ncbi:hypothetical protein [Mycobacterium sp. C31M]
MSTPEVAAALRSTIKKGLEPSVPYARKWEIGGCAATHSLRSFPYDGIQVLSEGLIGLGRPLVKADAGVVVGDMEPQLWVAANRSIRGDGPPDAYAVGQVGDKKARYTGNSPEVVVKLIESSSQPVPATPNTDVVQVGFPGLPDRGKTYVGSWQWGVHGEARDSEFIHRAAAATLAAIGAREADNAD